MYAKIIPALGVAFCGLVVAAQAQTISIGDTSSGSFQVLPPYDPITQYGQISYPGGAFGAGANYTTSVTDTSGGGTGAIGAQTTVVTIGGGVMGEQIWVTDVGLVVPPVPVAGNPHKYDFTSNFTYNSLPTGATVEEITYVDPSNDPFGTAFELGSTTFTPGSKAPVTVLYAHNPVVLANLFSVTEEYVVTAPSSSQQVQADIQLSISDEGPRPPIPEASTWAMLGLGFAGVGFAALRRRKGARYAL